MNRIPGFVDNIKKFHINDANSTSIYNNYNTLIPQGTIASACSPCVSVTAGGMEVEVLGHSVSLPDIGRFRACCKVKESVSFRGIRTSTECNVEPC